MTFYPPTARGTDLLACPSPLSGKKHPGRQPKGLRPIHGTAGALQAGGLRVGRDNLKPLRRCLRAVTGTDGPALNGYGPGRQARALRLRRGPGPEPPGRARPGFA